MHAHLYETDFLANHSLFIRLIMSGFCFPIRAFMLKIYDASAGLPPSFSNFLNRLSLLKKNR